MWLVDNRTPFAVERGWIRDRDGAELWLVIVKCTFTIGINGTTTVAEDQPEAMRLAEHQGVAGKSSVKYEADFVLTKTTTDVLVCGHAWAPHGRPVTQVDVGFRVGPVQKRLRVTGDREWGAFGPTAPQPFLRMPLVYERAFGGVDVRSHDPERDWDWRNPVGKGFAVSRENLDGTLLPNIEYADDPPLSSWHDRPAPAGFGPVASHWQPRVGFAGTYDDVWMQERQPLLPTDFDDRFYQCAPADQQAPAFLRGGEAVALVNLAAAADLRFVLPTVALALETRFYDGTRQRHVEPRLHTVILEPDHPRVSLVFHTALPCHFKVHDLERTIVTSTTHPGPGVAPVTRRTEARLA